MPIKVYEHNVIWGYEYHITLLVIINTKYKKVINIHSNGQHHIIYLACCIRRIAAARRAALMIFLAVSLVVVLLR